MSINSRAYKNTCTRSSRLNEVITSERQTNTPFLFNHLNLWRALLTPFANSQPWFFSRKNNIQTSHWQDCLHFMRKGLHWWCQIFRFYTTSVCIPLCGVICWIVSILNDHQNRNTKSLILHSTLSLSLSLSQFALRNLFICRVSEKKKISSKGGIFLYCFGYLK